MRLRALLFVLLLALLPAPPTARVVAQTACASPLAPDAAVAPAARVRVLEDVWSTVRDAYLYRDFRGLDWDAALVRYRARIAGAGDAGAVYRTLDAMVRELGDDHSVVLAPWEACAEDAAWSGAAPPAARAVRARRLEHAPRTAFLRIADFDSTALPWEVEAALRPLLDAGPLEGLVLDLRGNPGGYLEAAYGVLGHFVTGEVGREVDGLGATPVVLEPGSLYDALDGVPVAVLVDRDTHSAAELVAAVLQVERRARVIGERSAGNTEIVVPYDFRDGSRLWLAVGGFRLRSGADLEGVGVRPDVASSRPAPTGPDSDLAAALQSLAGAPR